ncbi:AraC family transcriptional regulator [Gracilibacillus sp. YIM 98692]|uniref:AraC family transcriptional regulator n=1 Tax=Gracilibacillus sp. YIM 98692 TaxID=2663532 RepID=UPI0013D0E4EE|nr:AraC family transcriptional regulator [Gracilibacillus sp. YIM 98692]
MENASVLYITEKYFDEFSFLFCGQAYCEPRHSFGPAIRPYYILHIILGGKGTFTQNHTTYHLEKGQGFLIEPKVITHYQADPYDPWTYMWIGFDGSNVTFHLNRLGLNLQAPTFQINDTSHLEKIIYDMLAYRHKEKSNMYSLYALFYLFLSNLSLEVGHKLEELKLDDNYHVQQAIQYIQLHYHQPMKIHDIAASINVNRSYLSTLFQSKVGQTLQQYITDLRMAKAQDLLHATSHTIETVARSCGYDNQLVFSKAFKRKVGIAPSEYRKKKHTLSL